MAPGLRNHGGSPTRERPPNAHQTTYLLVRFDLTLPAALIEHLPFVRVQLGLPVKENAGEAGCSSTWIENFDCPT